MPRWGLHNRVHSSWSLAVVCVGIILGVILSRYVPQPMFSSLSWLLTGILLTVLSLLRPYFLMLTVALMSGILIGAWRGSVTLSELQPYASMYGRSATVSGKVNDDVETNKRGQLVLRITELRISGKPISGTMWVTTKSAMKIRRGDMVRVDGKIGQGFGSFAATMYSAKTEKVVRPVPGDVAVTVRDWFASGIQKSINGTESALGIGFLTGQHRNLPDTVDEALKVVGLTHIVVASGYNLTVLVRASRRLFEKISKYLAFISAGGLLLGFVAMTGLSPSMSRAGLVTGLSLAAWYFGRRFHPFVLLPLVMAITLLLQPSYAWGDLGWQLSFAAFIGIMIVAPILSAYFFEDGKLNWVQAVFIETFAAWICTLPILVNAFGQFSVLAIIANMVVLPVLPLAMLLTFVTGVCAIVSPLIATVPGYLASLILRYIETIASYLSGIEWASNTVVLPNRGVLVAYGAIVIVLVYMAHQSRVSFLAKSALERVV